MVHTTNVRSQMASLTTGHKLMGMVHGPHMLLMVDSLQDLQSHPIKSLFPN